jgi:hypothetical protein
MFLWVLTVDVMRNSDNISQVSMINDQGYIFSLEREISLLKEENEALKLEMSEIKSQEIPSHRAAERERLALISYLQEIDRSLTGIPAIVKVIREVLKNVIDAVEKGEHIQFQLFKQFKR